MWSIFLRWIKKEKKKLSFGKKYYDLFSYYPRWIKLKTKNFSIMNFVNIFVPFIVFNIFSEYIWKLYMFIIWWIILSTILDSVYSIECFACAITREILKVDTNKPVILLPCINFNATSDYIIDCPFSTMCSRIISTMYLQNGKKQTTITLGCAQQKFSRHVRLWKVLKKLFFF